MISPPGAASGKEYAHMILFKQEDLKDLSVDLDPENFSLRKAIEKTRQAMDTAYAGFNNATEFDMIDSYIYEINALQRRYRHLIMLAQNTTPEGKN